MSKQKKTGVAALIARFEGIAVGQDKKNSDLIEQFEDSHRGHSTGTTDSGEKSHVGGMVEKFGGSLRRKGNHQILRVSVRPPQEEGVTSDTYLSTSSVLVDTFSKDSKGQFFRSFSTLLGAPSDEEIRMSQGSDTFMLAGQDPEKVSVAAASLPYEPMPSSHVTDVGGGLVFGNGRRISQERTYQDLSADAKKEIRILNAKIQGGRNAYQGKVHLLSALPEEERLGRAEDMYFNHLGNIVNSYAEFRKEAEKNDFSERACRQADIKFRNELNSFVENTGLPNDYEEIQAPEELVRFLALSEVKDGRISPDTFEEYCHEPKDKDLCDDVRLKEINSFGALRVALSRKVQDQRALKAMANDKEFANDLKYLLERSMNDFKNAETNNDRKTIIDRYDILINKLNSNGQLGHQTIELFVCFSLPGYEFSDKFTRMTPTLGDIPNVDMNQALIGLLKDERDRLQSYQEIIERGGNPRIPENKSAHGGLGQYLIDVIPVVEREKEQAKDEGRGADLHRAQLRRAGSRHDFVRTESFAVGLDR